MVAYYSRTGVTRRCAEEVAAALACDCVEIRDERDREGFAGSVSGLLEAVGEAYTEIQVAPLDFSSYNVVVVGTPVWGCNMAPAVRTFLTDHAAELKALGLFTTMSLMGARRTLRNMQILCNTEAVATLALTGGAVSTAVGREAVSAFATRIKGCAG